MFVIFNNQCGYGIDGTAAIRVKHGAVGVDLVLLLVDERGWGHCRRCWLEYGRYQFHRRKRKKAGACGRRSLCALSNNQNSVAFIVTFIWRDQHRKHDIQVDGEAESQLSLGRSNPSFQLRSSFVQKVWGRECRGLEQTPQKRTSQDK